MASLRNVIHFAFTRILAQVRNFKFSGKKTFIRIALPFALILPTHAIVALPAWACNGNPTLVSSTTANGTYGAGSVINVYAQWSTSIASVTGGVPYITLNLGAGVTRNATYTGIVGGTQLHFSYTVQAGDASSDLQYVSQFSLVASGATFKYIASCASYAVGLVLPALSGSSLATNKAIVIGGGAALASVSTLTGLTAFEHNEVTNALSATPVTLTPTFASATTSYAASLRNDQTGLWVNATWNGTGETASVSAPGFGPFALTSGTSLGKIPISVGVRNVVVTGYAQNGTTTSYTITVTRAAATENRLTGIALSNGLALSPTFESNTVTYSVAAANETSTVNITPTWAGVGETATATFGGSTYALTSGSQLATAMSLNVGANTLVITGYAQNGTTRTYTTTITRAPSSVSTLSALSLNNGLTLSPSFAAATTTYSVAATNESSTVRITPTWVGVGETATVTFGGNTYALTNGIQSATSMNLNVGANTLTIRGFAASGATTTYTVTITRAASSVSTLSALSLNNGLTLSPSFASGTTTYTAAASYDTSTVNITPTWVGVGETATATFGGSTYALTSSSQLATAMNLSVGANTLTVKGYAASGATTTYTVTITRASAASTSSITSLSFSSGLRISPTFDSATTTYSATALVDTSTANITVTWNGVGETATATFGGSTYPLANGVQLATAISIANGANTISVKGFAQDGSTTTYTTTITRVSAPPPPNFSKTANGIATLSWSDLSSSYPGLTGYVLRYKKINDSSWLSTTLGPNSLSTKICVGWSGNTNYQLAVIVNGVESPYSTSTTETVGNASTSCTDSTVGYAYSISFDSNTATSGSVSPFSGTAASIVVPGNEFPGFTKTSSYFAGWNSLANGLGTPYKAGDVIQLSSAFTGRTFFAQWGTLLSAPNKPTGSAVSGRTDRITVNFSSVTNASSYTLNLYLASDTSTAIRIITGFTSGSTITGLDASTAYVVGVIAIGNGVNYADSAQSTLSDSITTNNRIVLTVGSNIETNYARAATSSAASYTGGNTPVVYTIQKASDATSVSEITINISTGAVTASATTAIGSYTMRVIATDNLSVVDSATMTVTINAALSMSAGSNISTFYGTAASSTAFTATGGTSPKTYTVVKSSDGTDLSGVTVNSSGVVTASNTTAAGTTTMRVIVTDAIGAVDSRTMTVAVSGVTLATPTAPTGSAVSESTTALSIVYSGSRVSNTTVYSIKLYKSSDNSLVASVQETYSTGTTTFSGLTADTNYYATVTAIGSGNYLDSAESSASATITTNALPVSPVITSQPTNTAITSGNTASFAVTATRSDGGVLSYQWQSATIGSFSNVSGATSATYTTPALTVADSGTRYRVLVYNSKNGATSSAVTSESATVSVNAITLSTPTAPTGSAVSESTTALSIVYSGSRVSNTTVYSIKLYKSSDNSLVANVQETYSTGTTTFSGLTADTNYYATVTAIGSGNYGNSAESSASATITTNALPVSPVITSQPTNLIITSGNTASFAVTATRSDGGVLSYQWQSATIGSFSNVSGATSATYTTPALTVADSGTRYRVLVYNSKNGATSSAVTSESATVTVGSLTLSTPTAPTGSAVSESTTALSIVYSGSRVSNTTVYSIKLYKSSDNSLVASVQETYSTGTTTFSGLTADTNYYATVTAIGSGNYGNSAESSASATITTNALPVSPVITSQPTNTAITSGNTASFAVTATRSDGGVLSYQWQSATIGSFSNVSGATSATYTTPALTVADSGTRYRVLVYNSKNGATSSAVTSESATVSVNAITLSTPTAPTGSAVSESTTALSIVYSGSRVSNTTVYSIKLYKSSDNSLVASVQETYSTGTTTFSGLTADTNYYATVTAIGSGNYGNSAESSASATITTNALPVSPVITSQPTNTAITSGNTASFAVTATRSDGGVLSYQWQSATIGSFSNVSGATSATYTTPALTVADSGTRYRVLVYNSKNGATSSAVTSESATVSVNAITLSTPTAPTGSAVSESTTALSIVYSGSRVSNTTVYSIKLYKSSDNSLVASVQETYSTGTTTFSGLTADTNYYATVTAIGSGNYGNSAESSASATITTNALPVSPVITSQPTNLIITSGNTASFAVTATRSDGGVLSYQWQSATIGSFSNVSGATSATYTTPALTVADSGTRYRVLVYNSKNGATSSAVTSESATVSVNAITLSTPTAPTGSAVSESTTALSIVYSGSRVSNTTVYSIKLYKSSDNSLVASVQETYSTGTTTFSGLTADTNYYATVTAIGSGNYGNSAESSASATITTNALPVSPVITSQPTNTAITSGNTASFAVTATRSDGGVLSYQWQSATIGSFSNVSGATSATYTTPALTVADSGTRYRVLVYNSKNGATSSAVTSESATVSVNAITLSTPTAPTGSAVSGSTTALSIVYSGSRVSNTTVYSIKLYKSSDNSLVASVQETYSTGTTTFSGLTADTNYYATVTAIGSGNYGNSAESSASATITTNALPVSPVITSQPTNTAITSGNTASFAVTATRSDGGVLSYQWQSATIGSFSNVSGATSATYTTPALTVADSGTRYRVLVYNSKNGATSSAVTSESATVSVNAITLSTPTAPTGSAVSGSATSITVNYSAVSNSTTYQIRVYTTSGGTLIATVTDTYSTGSVIVSGLTSDTSYYVTVTALGSGNYSDSTASLQSNAIVTNAILAKPGAPTVSATSSALKSIDISWSSVSDSTGYQVNIYNSSGATLLETSTVTSGTSLRLTASQYSGITDGTQYRIALVAIGDSTHLNSPESDKSAVTTNSTAATPTILSHPSSISKSATQSGSFTVSATRTDSGTLNYQWEVSTDSGTTWSNVSDGSGATTATYTTASLTTLLNGYQYRAKVTNSLLGTTAVTYSNAATLSVAKVNQSSLSIITLNGRTDRTLTLITSGGSSGGVVTYTTGDPDCTLSGASLNRTTPGYCPIIATMAGTDTVYNPVSSVEKNIEFADGSNSVDVTFEDNTTNSVFEYQSTRYVSAAVKESGTVKFFQDNRAIPGCTAIKAATGRPATCIWKPSTLGSTSVTAVLTPSNTANPQRTSQPAIATIIPKS